jgi:hypothetical protein
MTIGLAISFYHHFQTMKAVLQTSMAVDQAGLFQKRTVLFFGCQDCPVPVAVVFVYFNLDTATGALTYQFEEENVQHEARGPPGLYGRTCSDRNAWGQIHLNL